MAEGDIGAVVDTLTFGAVRGHTPSMIHVSGNIYAIAFEGPDQDGWLVTVSIDAAGAISNAVIDSLEYDPVFGITPRIIHIDGEIFAIVYGGETSHGYIVTVSIDAAGAISNAVIDSLEYDPLNGQFPDIIHLINDVFVIVAQSEASIGKVQTLTISDAGVIGAAIIDSYAFYATATSMFRVAKVSANVFAIVFKDASNDGRISTVSIANNGSITKAVIDSLEFETADCWDPDLIHIAGDIYAIAYSGLNSDGFLKTVSVDAAGAISNAFLDSYEFDAVNGFYPKIIHVSGNVFAIAYQGALLDGWLITLTVADDGVITKAIIGSLEFDPVDCTYSSVVHVTGNIYAIAYSGTLVVGKLLTVSIETTPEGKVHHLMIMGMD